MNVLGIKDFLCSSPLLLWTVEWGHTPCPQNLTVSCAEI